MSIGCRLFGHRMRAQGAERVTLYANQESKIPYGYATNVLLRCERCPRFESTRITGHWTLEQLVLGEEMTGSPNEAKVSR